MPVKNQGLNFDLGDGYCTIFGKLASRIDGDQWMHMFDGSFVEVSTSGIIGGIHLALDCDRDNGVLDKVAAVHMNPEFALLMLQQGTITADMFDDADEGLGWIALAPLQYRGACIPMMIIDDLPVGMRTVDADGASL